MKKTKIISALLAAVLLLSFVLTGCSTEEPVSKDPPENQTPENQTPEGTDPENTAPANLAEIVYTRNDYPEGDTLTYRIDLEENKTYRKRSLSKYESAEGLSEEELASDFYINNNKLVEIKSFSEAEEAEFLSECTKSGLFTVASCYNISGAATGDGWQLDFKYSDGTVKTSLGIEDCPDSVFRSCAFAFYAIAGEAVLEHTWKSAPNPPVLDITVLENGEPLDGK